MTVILATGGSAGHLYPAIEVAKELTSRKYKVQFLGTFHAGKKSLDDNGFSYKHLNSRGLQGKGWLSDGMAICSLIFTTVVAMVDLVKNRPKVIIGFGGYGAFPVVLAGGILRIPTMIHEQNVVPGRANQILGRIVCKVAVSFDDTKRYFDKKKVVHTGCPVAVSGVNYIRKDLLSEFDFKNDRTTVLVFGGSQGSERINSVFCECIADLAEQMKIQVFHITGRGKSDGLEAVYTKLNIPCIVKEFYGEMEKAYVVSDIVICRSGASTVNELAVFKKPAVIIPYPYAGGHQKKNALILQKYKIASILGEENLSPHLLGLEIKKMCQISPDHEKFELLLKELNIQGSVARIVTEIERYL